MTKIIVEALPHSVFVGTREFLEQARETIRLSNLTPEEYTAEAKDRILDKLQEEWESNNELVDLDELNSGLQQVKMNKTAAEIEKAMQAFEKWIPTSLYEMDTDGKIIISQEKIDLQNKRRNSVGNQSY